MAEIILKSNTPAKAADILKDALAIEASRLKYSLNLAKKRLKRFETKYNISSEKFLNEWSAEDLKGKDLEYDDDDINENWETYKQRFLKGDSS